MCRHPEPLRNRLKVLLLLVNARPTTPPPRLMYKRPMRRIHQPNDPVVDVARQVSHKVRAAKPLRKLRQLRHRRQRIANAASSRLRQINPRVAVTLLARVSAGINLGRIERLKLSQRRNLDTLPAARLEPPAMILALHRLAVEPPCRQRNPTMRTKIAHRENFSILLAPQHQRNAKQHGLGHLSYAQLPGPQRWIPIAKDL